MIRQTFEELKATGNLPSPAGVGMRILQLTQNDDFSADELAKTIMSDPALTGRLLRIANSAALAGAHKATTVVEATMRLGARAVKDVALGLTLISSHKEGRCAYFDYQRFWALSLARAVAAQTLSRTLRVAVPAETYVLGLLAEVGALGLASVHPEPYAQVLAAARGSRGTTLLALERKTFEIDHTEVSAYMLEEWGLPEPFARAVQLFVQREEVLQAGPKDVAQLARVLRLADAVAEYCTWDPSRSSSSLAGLSAGLERTRETLAISVDEFSTLLEGIATEWAEWGSILEVETRKPIPLDELRQHAQVEVARYTASPDATHTTRALRILAVDDEPVSLRLLAKTLEKGGHQVQTASNGADALRVALETNPQVVVADWMMPEMDGLDLCRSLRRIEIGRSMYFLLLTGRGEEDRIVEAFDAGVDDYVVKPFNGRVLMARIKGGQRVIELQCRVEEDKEIMRRQVAELALMSRRMKTAAHTDMLTELPNRRHAMKTLEENWIAAERDGRPLSVIMIDLDHFKRVNDTYGHDVGDLVLRETAAVLRRTARVEEEVARLGGEEFLVILPLTDAHETRACAERLRVAVEANVIDSPDYKGSVTCSLGFATRSADMLRYEDLVKAADEAVYASKAAGRNCATGAETPVRRAEVA